MEANADQPVESLNPLEDSALMPMWGFDGAHEQRFFEPESARGSCADAN